MVCKKCKVKMNIIQNVLLRSSDDLFLKFQCPICFFIVNRKYSGFDAKIIHVNSKKNK